MSYIKNLDVKWYEKLNLVEYVIQLLKSAFLKIIDIVMHMFLLSID